MEELNENKKTSIEDIYNSVRINWARFYASIDDCQNDSPIEFEVMPEEYLQFAKNNLKSNNRQSCIDAMSNAKRSIECQIDLLINTLGYDYRKFDARNTYNEAKIFVNNNYKEEQYDGLTERLKLLNTLELAPTLILSNIRNMRNQMEHGYNVPSYNEVKKAIEVADLFINSSNRKLSYSPTILYLGNNQDKNKDNYCAIKYPLIRIRFNIQYSVNTVSITAIKCEIAKNIEHKDIENKFILINGN